MPIVTLTTDFGNKDYYVGALKGELLKALPGFTIIDISHNIKPYSISEAAFVLKNAFSSFPEGTAHIVTVNDLDEREIRFVAAQYEKQFFIGLDNGIFNIAFNHAPEHIVELPSHKQNGNLASFSGKKIFAQAAAQLAGGKNIEELGIAVAALNERTGLEPVVQESLIRGTVIHIDAFQNVIVNVTKELFTRTRKQRNFTITYRSRINDNISVISESYHDVGRGEKLCLFNSSGYMEIAINCGEAGRLLGIKTGDYILIDFE